MSYHEGLSTSKRRRSLINHRVGEEKIGVREGVVRMQVLELHWGGHHHYSKKLVGHVPLHLLQWLCLRNSGYIAAIPALYLSEMSCFGKPECHFLKFVFVCIHFRNVLHLKCSGREQPSTIKEPLAQVGLWDPKWMNIKLMYLWMLITYSSETPSTSNHTVVSFHWLQSKLLINGVLFCL